MKEITLSTGVVLRCRLVPPYLRDSAFASVPEPEFPMLSLKSAAGGTEEQPALEGSPEYEVYMQEMAGYRRTLRRISLEFDLLYGVAAWKLLNTDKFTEDIPSGWELPSIMKRYGVTPAEDPDERRIQFVRWLIKTDKDVDAVEDAIGGAESLTEEEVETAIAPFDSGSV